MIIHPQHEDLSEKAVRIMSVNKDKPETDPRFYFVKPDFSRYRKDEKSVLLSPREDKQTVIFPPIVGRFSPSEDSWRPPLPPLPRHPPLLSRCSAVLSHLGAVS